MLLVTPNQQCYSDTDMYTHRRGYYYFFLLKTFVNIMRLSENLAEYLSKQPCSRAWCSCCMCPYLSARTPEPPYHRVARDPRSADYGGRRLLAALRRLRSSSGLGCCCYARHSRSDRKHSCGSRRGRSTPSRTLRPFPTSRGRPDSPDDDAGNSRPSDSPTTSYDVQLPKYHRRITFTGLWQSKHWINKHYASINTRLIGLHKHTRRLAFSLQTSQTLVWL